MIGRRWIASVLTVMLLCAFPTNGFLFDTGTTIYAEEALEEMTIGQFESDEEVWQLGLGDGAGAQGAFIRDTVDPYAGLFSGKLNGNFSSGGQYVSVGKNLMSVDMKSLSFQIKTSDITKILIRVKDATGQVHQQYITLDSTADWQKVEVNKFDGGQNYLSFGGANDRVWHGPAQRVEFLLEKPRLHAGKTSGQLWLDDITAMVPPQEPMWASEIGSFENAVDLWDIGFGQEFPGAKGDFARDASQFKTGSFSGKLTGDFNSGGKYVALGRSFPPVDMQKLEFWVKTSDAQWLTLRLKDGTGQVHQQRITLTPNGNWSKVEVFKFDGGLNYLSFGGANDQKWHGPAERVEFLLEQSSFVNGKPNGEIWLDGVIVTSPYPDLAVQQTQLGNVFLESEPVTLQVATKGTSVSWSVYDHLDHMVLEGNHAVQDNLLDLTIPLQKLGYYTMNISAEQEGTSVASTEISLARLSDQDPTLAGDSPFGISTHLAWAKEGWSPELSKLIRRAGAKSFRDEITWESLEYEKGKYRKPANRDAFMKRTLQDDLQPFIILNYTNPFYDQNSTPYTDEGRQGYADYGVALLDLYGNQIESIEVYNEFNGSFGSRGNGIAASRPDYYFKMLKATYETVKAARPDVTVVGMATAGTPLNWIEEVFKLGGLQYMDAVSIHPYQSQRPPDGMIDAVRSTQALMRQYNNGQVKPIWYTEIGWPTKASIGIPENMQANYLVRTYVQALGEGVEKVFWYDLMNDGMQEDYHEHHFGMLRNREDEKGAFTPKPSYASYAAMTRELIGAAFVEQEYAGTDIYSYKFDKSGESLRVVWSNEPMQAAIETNSPIQIPDMMGNTETYSPYQGKVYITLSGEPHYVKGEIDGIAQSSMFSIFGETMVAGEAIALTLRINNEHAMPAAFNVEFEGQSYSVQAAGGQQATQALQAASMSEIGTRVLTGFVWEDGKKIGKLQYEVKSLQPYEVRAQPTMSAKDVEQKMLALHITNFSKLNELVVSGIEWQLGDQQGVETIKQSIEPDRTNTLTIPLDKLELETSYPVQVKVHFENHESFVYQGKLDFNPIYASTIQVDGKIDSDVEKSQPTLHLSQGTVKMNDYKGQSDLDGQVWLRYDRDYFYLTAQITDDAHAYSADGADIWKNDSIQFALAQGVPGSASEWYEYGISDTAKGPQIYRWNATAGMSRGPVTNGKLQIARNEEQKQTVYELALPWSELAPMKYAHNSGIHFSLLVNDNDGNGRKGWIEWASGIGVEKKPNLYRTMQWMVDAEQWPAPIAHSAAYQTKAGVAVQGFLKADQTAETALRYEIVDNGAQGTVVIVDSETGEFTYTPQSLAQGEDSFTFRVYDGYEYSNTATVAITIEKPIVNPPTSPGGYIPNVNTSSTGHLYLPSGEAGEISLGKLIQLVIAAGSTSEGTTLTIEELKGDKELTEPKQQLLSPVFQLSSKPAVQLQKTAAVSIAFDAAKLGKGQKASIWFYDEQQKQWIEIGGKTKGALILAELKQLGKYAVFAVDNEEGTKPNPGKESFADVKGHWGQAAIEKALQLNIVHGYEDHTFRPNQPVSRQEFVVMLDRALQPKGNGETVSFSDEVKIGAWAKSSISKAVQAGWLSGYSDGSFRPSEGISRAEMAVMLVKAAKVTPSKKTKSSFSDDDAIPAWAKSYVDAALAQSLLQGRGGNRFVPAGVVTRAEAAIVAVKLIEGLEQ